MGKRFTQDPKHLVGRRLDLLETEIIKAILQIIRVADSCGWMACVNLYFIHEHIHHISLSLLKRCPTKVSARLNGVDIGSCHMHESRFMRSENCIYGITLLFVSRNSLKAIWPYYRSHVLLSRIIIHPLQTISSPTSAYHYHE